MTRVLAIRLRQMGDVIVTLGALRDLKRVYPTTHVTFMADAHFHPLLADVEYIDALLPQPPRVDGVGGFGAFAEFVDGLRARRFDAAIDFHSNPRSAFLSYIAGAPKRTGFDVKLRKFLYSAVEPRAVYENGRPKPRTAHAAAVALCARAGFPDLAGTAVGTIAVGAAARARGRELLAAVGVSPDNGELVALNPGKPYPAKAWPVQYFVELAQQLVAAGKSVVVCWGPGEREAAERIGAEAGAGVFLAPPTQLGEVAGLIAHFAAVVGIDSGLKHLCVATGVPTVTLFGPTSPAEWHMGGDSDIALSARLSCSPCRLTACPFGEPCMRRLKPRDVLAALGDIEAVAA